MANVVSPADLAHLSRHTHRVATVYMQLIALDKQIVILKSKNYGAKQRYQYTAMTLTAGEFIRLFLLHVLPSGFYHIRHFGLITNPTHKANLTERCELLIRDKTQAPTDAATNGADAADGDNLDESATYVCPYCGAPMILIDTLRVGHMPYATY